MNSIKPHTKADQTIEFVFISSQIRFKIHRSEKIGNWSFYRSESFAMAVIQCQSRYLLYRKTPIIKTSKTQNELKLSSKINYLQVTQNKIFLIRKTNTERSAPIEIPFIFVNRYFENELPKHWQTFTFKAHISFQEVLQTPVYIFNPA